MNKFLILIFSFFLPIIVLIGVPSYLLWNARENFHSLDKEIENKSPDLVGFAYNENNYGYIKWKNIQSAPRYSTWALGSSRVLSFREEMFDSSFYNAGFTISSINDFLPFLKCIPKVKYPHYLIIGLDHWMFNANWDNLQTELPENHWKNSFTFLPKADVYKQFISEIFKEDPLRFFTLSAKNRIGINANFHNTGFRNDGSIFYGGQISKLMNADSTANDFKYSNTFDRIKKGKQRFEYGQETNEKAFEKLVELMSFCNQHTINVIGFLPPFADKVYDHMDSSGNYKYLENIPIRLNQIMTQYNFEFYDFSTVSKCGSNDNETMDGFHGGEVTYQKILIEMLNKNSALNKVSDKEKLLKNLHKKPNNYFIYKD